MIQRRFGEWLNRPFIKALVGVGNYKLRIKVQDVAKAAALPACTRRAVKRKYLGRRLRKLLCAFRALKIFRKIKYLIGAYTNSDFTVFIEGGLYRID